MLVTLGASRLLVLAVTPPQASSNALPMTLALVPRGPEPMMKGLGNLIPFTVVARVGMLFLLFGIYGSDHRDVIQDKCEKECNEPGVGVDGVPERGGFDYAYGMEESRGAGSNGEDQCDYGAPIG